MESLSLGMPSPPMSFASHVRGLVYESSISSAFQCAVALDLLQDIADEVPDLERIRENLFNDLLRRQNDWRFSEDVFTQFLCLSAVTKYRPDAADGALFSEVAKDLIALESRPGGPYLQNGEADPGTNAAINLFLQRQGIALSGLQSFLRACIESGQCRSKFVTDPFLTFLLASVCPEEHRQACMTMLLQKREAFARQGIVPTCWLVLSLARLGCPSVMLQKTFPALPMPEMVCEEASPLKDEQGKTSAEALNRLAALCAHHFVSFREEAATGAESRAVAEEREMYARILSVAKERFAALGEELREIALAEIESTMQGNVDKQMAFMPFFTRQALGENGDVFSDRFIAELGLANVYFWTGFIIYDNFWDEDEEAKPSSLPAANLYTRELVTYFHRILPDAADFHRYFNELMDRLDAANAWETVRCRAEVGDGVFVVPASLPDFGNYERKYQPASAHVLGSVAMLRTMGFAMNSPEMKNLISYFENYLIPMQINDDLHDWEEDLNRGHVSTVLAMLLEDMEARPGDRIHLQEDLERVQAVFWNKTLPRACARMEPFLRRSRASLQSISCFRNAAPLEQYIVRIEKSMEEALREHRLSHEFLEAFRS